MGETDLHLEGGSRVVPVLAGEGLRESRLAGACLGFDGQSFPSAAGDSGSEPFIGHACLAGDFQPGVEQPLLAPGPCVSGAIQVGAGGGRGGCRRKKGHKKGQ